MGDSPFSAKSAMQHVLLAILGLALSILQGFSHEGRRAAQSQASDPCFKGCWPVRGSHQCRDSYQFFMTP